MAAETIKNVTDAACICEVDRIILYYSGKIDEKELFLRIKKILPIYMMPDTILRLDQIPKNPNGKKDRVRLQNEYVRKSTYKCEYEHKDFFGKVIFDYENSNRSYPHEMIEDIVNFSDITENSELLEVGAATGTATDYFLNYAIDILEITKEQVDYLKEKYKAYPRINVIQDQFENYLSEKNYNLIFAGTSFHWIDSKIGYPKLATHLAEGGSIALFWNLNYRYRGEEAYAELQEIECKYRLCLADNTEDYLGRLKFIVTANVFATGMFCDMTTREYQYKKKYDVNSYLSWIRSRYYLYEKMSIDEQKGFEKEVKTKFLSNPLIEIPQVILLVMAKKK